MNYRARVRMCASIPRGYVRRSNDTVAPSIVLILADDLGDPFSSFPNLVFNL
jgi:hypothetical protein